MELYTNKLLTQVYEHWRHAEMAERDGWKAERGWAFTWGLVLGVAAGVHQNVGLKGGVKVVICTEEGRTK